AWREGHRQRVEEDELRRRGGEPGFEAREGREPRGARARRIRFGDAARRWTGHLERLSTHGEGPAIGARAVGFLLPARPVDDGEAVPAARELRDVVAVAGRELDDALGRLRLELVERDLHPVELEVALEVVAEVHADRALR